MELFKGSAAEAIRYIFQTMLITYLLLLIIEEIWRGTVTNYVNTSYILIAVIVLGICSVFSSQEHSTARAITWKDYLFIVLVAFGGAFIIHMKTVQLGWLSWVLTVLAGILIILLSLLIFNEDEE